MIPDTVSLVVAQIKADAGVQGIAGQDVFAGELSEATIALMPTAAVVVAPAGGPGRPGYQRYRRTRIDVVCYGENLKQSWQLHQAVREVLENIRRAGSLFWAEVVSDGANARDPQTQWPVCYATYLVMTATEA